MDTGETFLEALKGNLRARFSPKQRTGLKRWLAEPLGSLCRGDLTRLAHIYGSDKAVGHAYCQHYQRHFAKWRKQRFTLLEIGIGGYDDPSSGGNSLRMWRRYFSRALICGIDIADKTPLNSPRIHTFQGDQSDAQFLKKVIGTIGRPSIIIDDGSHLNDHVIRTFEVLFPLLAENGIYVVEDTQTSYWPEFRGSSDDLMSAATSMCLFKRLVDGLNHAEFIRPGYQASYLDKHIVAIHFYHNLVFIDKGPNNEGSNMVTNNMPHGSLRGLSVSHCPT